MDYKQLYTNLNDAQRQAVDTIDGPVLVLAGPGTGKTQLLSARVANILQKTDTPPQNILCLTFTENGAANMRERLTRFIGQSAYDVNISTYHGFGSDVIYRFPQYFTTTRLQNPIDQLGRHQILSAIIDTLSYKNPLKQLQHHIGDLVSTISELKRALLTPDSLRAIAAENLAYIKTATEANAEPLAALSAMSRMSAAATPHFVAIFETLQSLPPQKPHTGHSRFGNLATLAIDSLGQAIAEAADTKKTTPLTAWKDAWLAKDANNHYIFAGDLTNRRIIALADTFEKYQTALESQGLYDFDDMIARTIEALEKYPDFKFSLQEQYLYILLDEFQDTNAAQLRLVELLTDNPVHEARPNVMAVGDDDQAIYAFQGAHYSNMVDFYQMFRDVVIIPLTHNYRSGAPILELSTNVATQISSRLQTQLPDINKQLIAASSDTGPFTIIRQELLSDTAERDWIAKTISDLIKQGKPASSIAVLAPKHRYLEPLVAHLNALDIPVQYEKRENVLESPIVRELLTMSKLVMALASGAQTTANALWPEVLSYPFWQIPVADIWRLSWEIRSSKDQEADWLIALLNNPAYATPAHLFASLALQVHTISCETALDILLGTIPAQTNDPVLPEVLSPLRSYYTSTEQQADKPELFYDTISALKVLQSKLRDHQAASNRTLTLPDLLTFVQMYKDSGEMLLNTTPHQQSADAAQLMTVFKAKGLEFDHVFLPSCHDDVWGGGSRGMRNMLTLPENLTPIRHAGATDDERLRILFVALTRARQALYLTSHSTTYSGNRTKPLRYFQELQQADSEGREMSILPGPDKTVAIDNTSIPSLISVERDWRTNHLSSIQSTDLKAILAPQLKSYQLSPTHVNQFVDLVHGGPNEFILRTLLRFPQAPSASGQYGNAIHETLEWIQHHIAEQGTIPSSKEYLAYFAGRIHHKNLTDHQAELLIERGEQALQNWLPTHQGIFTGHTVAEHSFKQEGVFVGGAHLNGKIDLMQIDKKSRRITVIDYKTGTPKSKWSNSDPVLHKYRQQLYCYKLLIENSHTYKGYTVDEGRLEFIEPATDGQTYRLSLAFDDTEMERVKQLINTIWQRIMNLDFPDTSAYSQDLKGELAFEADLITGQELL